MNSPLFNVSVICGAWTGDLPKTQMLEGRRVSQALDHEARDKTTLWTNPEHLLSSFMELYDRDELAKGNSQAGKRRSGTICWKPGDGPAPRDTTLSFRRNACVPRIEGWTCTGLLHLLSFNTQDVSEHTCHHYQICTSCQYTPCYNKSHSRRVFSKIYDSLSVF